MAYPPDPGGQFDSSVHRRVAGILFNLEPDGQPLTPDRIMARVASDDQLNIGYDEASQVVADLVTAGAAQTDDEGRHLLTEAGQGAFPGPLAQDGGPVFHA